MKILRAPGAIECALLFEQDGSCPAAAAPCGNADPAAGCANSTGFGARPDGRETIVLAANKLVRTSSQLPAFTKSFLLMGSEAASSVPFRDDFSDGDRLPLVIHLDAYAYLVDPAEFL